MDEYPLPNMKDADLKKFMTLRHNLIAEKNKLETRLADINAALGSIKAGADKPAPAANSTPKQDGKRNMSAATRERIAAAQRKRWAARRSSAAPANSRTATGSARQNRGDITLKQAVLQLTSERPLTKKEIVAGLPSTGYKTKSKDPVNLLNPLFYGKKPAFKNVGEGRYAPR